VVAQELVAGADQDVAVAPRDGDHVVGHQPVAALHEIERRLALADGAPAGEQKADAVHVDERAVHVGLRREHGVEIRRQLVDERRGAHRRAQNRHLTLVGALGEVGGQLERLGHHDARNLELEQAVDGAAAVVFRELREVDALGLADDLQALGQEVLDEAHEAHPGAMDVAHRDVALGGQRLGQELEPQLLALILEQASHGQALHRCAPFPPAAARSP
jgi:hypothetical protein